MQADYVFVKVQTTKIEYVKILKRGTSWEYNDFLISIGIHADISVYDILNITDSYGVVIPEEHFIEIFFQNYTNPGFLLKIKTNENINILSTPVYRQNCHIGHEMYFTPQELENFLSKTQHAYVLLKKQKSDKSELQDLSDTERRAIIREAVNLLIEKYKHHPEHEHKLALAHAIIKIFPQLKTNDSNNGGVDLLYNRAENRGYIVTRLNNIRNKLYKIEAYEPGISKKRLSAVDRIENNKKHKTQEEAVSTSNCLEEELLILRNLNVSTQKENIKEKLKTTLKYREDALKNNKIKQISDAFPFFFTSPDLILFDFELRYPEASKNIINQWPIVADHIEKVWRGFKGQSAVRLFDIDDWLLSYQKFFYLLNLLPQTSLGKTSANTKRLPFRDCINRLIVFKPLNLTNDEFVRGTNISSPYLVAIGENTKGITNFMLCIERELIPLPSNFSLLEAMDMTFKAHYVFNQHFDESLRNFWIFISHFFYKIDNETLPIKIKDVGNKITKEISKIDD